MKILIIGASGLLGYDMCKELKRCNLSYYATDRTKCDVTDSSSVRSTLQDYLPDGVINCAAYTNVDMAEIQREQCFAVNAVGAENVAKACNDIHAKLIYISSDYVFDGKSPNMLSVNDPMCPLNYYGKTKMWGEQATQKQTDKAFILRSAWLFGTHGNNFVDAMLRLGLTQDVISVVDDQIGSPTYAQDLAKLICTMVQTDKYGIYHATNEGFCSRVEFAREIFSQGGINTRVRPISTEEYYSPAARPLNVQLDKISLEHGGFDRLPYWKDALKAYLAEKGNRT